MRLTYFLLFVLFASFANAQVLSNKETYTRADTLRGSLRPERSNFDVLKYDLSVKVEPDKKYISGNNKIRFKVLDSLPRMQIDLFANMQVDSIVYNNQKLIYSREYNAVFIDFPKSLLPNSVEEVNFYFSGKPKIAKNPPWDGGFIFDKDKNGKDWVSVAVQGTGASLWFPNKDHQSDEPETTEIHLIVPENLMGVSNGRLIGERSLGNGFKQFDWQVKNPINNYNIILNVGDYVHFSDQYKDLDLEYYVLSYNLEAAKKQFEQVKPMMACFYEKFGSYPFPEDSYKLVESPHLGMEHQSAVAYGNGFKNGYLGRDLSGTGIGLRWDFIIIHESAHEWFGNSITAADIADMWIHESFTAYAEAVFVECQYGKKDALAYTRGTRRGIANDIPIIGDYGVNSEGSGDMYYKGANMLNNLRSVLNNDAKWWQLLKDFHTEFKHQITNTKEVVDFFEKRTKAELTPIFNQYLRYTQVPQIDFRKENGKIQYRWEAKAEDFEMPLDLKFNGKQKRIYPTKEWKTLSFTKDMEAFEVDLDRFYVEIKK